MGTRVALVTDSTSNLSLEQAAELDVAIVPLVVIWDEKTYRDGIDVTEAEFYRMLAESKEIPSTSQASPQDFVNAFEAARQKTAADEIVCAVLSSDLSGTYASAIQAKAAVDYPVHVVDTRQITWALGHAVLAGVEARAAGASGAEIAAVIQQAATRQNVLFTIESLDYIHRGGRIGNARLLLGSALQIKPVLEIGNGIIESVENVRTRKRALEYLIKAAQERAKGCSVTRLTVIHGDAEEEARAVLDKAAKVFSPKETHFSYVCLTIGVHTGPGVVGLVIERTP